MKDSLLALLHHYPFLLAGGVGLIALEIWAWYRVHPGYFSQGLLMFKAEIPARLPAAEAVRWLTAAQPKSFWGELRFNALDTGEIAVRECIDWKHPWRPHYLPLMRATLAVDSVRGKLRMKAYLNYWLPLLLLPSLVFSLQKAAVPMHAATSIFGHALVMAVLYIIQVFRYQSLLNALEKQGQLSKPATRKFNGL